VGHVAARDRKAIEAAQRFMLALPEACDGAGASEEASHLLGLDLGEVDIPAMSTE